MLRQTPTITRQLIKENLDDVKRAMAMPIPKVEKEAQVAVIINTWPSHRFIEKTIDELEGRKPQGLLCWIRRLAEGRA